MTVNVLPEGGEGRGGRRGELTKIKIKFKKIIPIATNVHIDAYKNVYINMNIYVYRYMYISYPCTSGGRRYADIQLQNC